jgi:tetratricopeptide (TPR) repeat protein
MAAYQLYARVVKELPKTRTAARARGNMKYLKESFLDKAKALLKKAEAAFEEEEFEQVRKSLRELSVLGKDLPERNRIAALNREMKERIGKLARKLQSRARRAELLKNYKEALKWYKRILAMDPHGDYSLQAQQKIQSLEAKIRD